MKVTDTITVDKVHMELDREELQELRRETEESTADMGDSGMSPQDGKGMSGVLAFIRLGLHIQSMQCVFICW